MRAVLSAIALTGLAVAVSAQAPVALTPAQLAMFPPGDGRAATVRVCSGCHEPDIITRQRLAPADWAAIVEMMAGQGAQGSDADFAAITAYLSKAFPAD